MAVVASLHLADVGVTAALGVLRRPPRVGTVDGLRHADVAVAGTLGGSLLPSPTLGRVGLIAFWEHEEALDRFEAAHPLAQKLARGWRVRLEPLRAFGSWPGLPDAVPAGRTTDHDGPALVLTLGRLRLPGVVRFLRTSARAEAAVLAAPGLVWATGLARPPLVSTCSLWESCRLLTAYAYGSDEPAHLDAIEADRAKAFHHRSAFIRFRPYDSRGSLGGRNPLPERRLDALARSGTERPSDG